MSVADSRRASGYAFSLPDPFAPIGPLAGQHYFLSHVNGQPLPALGGRPGIEPLVLADLAAGRDLLTARVGERGHGARIMKATPAIMARSV